MSGRVWKRSLSKFTNITIVRDQNTNDDACRRDVSMSAALTLFGQRCVFHQSPLGNLILVKTP